MWYVYAILSALFIAIWRIIEKKVLCKEHSVEYNAASGIYTILILLAMIPILKIKLISIYSMLIVYGISIITTVTFLYRAKATRRMAISEIEPLFVLSPIFVLLLGYVFLDEKINSVNFVGIILIILGAYVLELDSIQNFFNPLKKFMKSQAINFFILATIGLSLGAILDKKVITTLVDPFDYLFWLMIFVSINFILLDLFEFGAWDVINSMKKCPFLTFLATLFHLANNLFYYLAIAVPGALISLIIPVRRSSSFFTTLIGGNIFKEKDIMHKTIACAIMVLGTYLLIL